MAIAELPGDEGLHRAIPRRDRAARARLLEVARAAKPVTGAGERRIPVGGDLGALLPDGGIPRGGVVSVDGRIGLRPVAYTLAAAATTAKEWAVLVADDVGGLAALEAGADPERFAVVRGVPRARWPTVVAALLEGVTLVLAVAPPGLRTGDARRLAARARERGAGLVVLGAWPAEAALRISVENATWSDPGDGHLGAPRLHLRVEGRTAPVAGRVALAG